MYEKGKAPRVMAIDVSAAIKAVDFTLLPDGRTTICTLTLLNGYTVRGESSCVFIENYVQHIGEQLSLEAARRQVWPLLGYALAEHVHQFNTVGDGESIVAKVERIARVCHEANRAYCLALGDTSQAVWEQAPQRQRDSAANGVTLHLNNPDAGPQASHEAWAAEKVAAGWVWGSTKDPEAKTHPRLIPFGHLTTAEQAKDFIFRAVVHALR